MSGQDVSTLREDLRHILKENRVSEEMTNVIFNDIEYYGYGCAITVRSGKEEKVERLFDKRRSEIVVYVKTLRDDTELNMRAIDHNYVVVGKAIGFFSGVATEKTLWYKSIGSGIYAKVYPYSEHGFKKEFILVDEYHYKLRTLGIVETANGCMFDDESPILDLHNKISLTDNSWVTHDAQVSGTCEISEAACVGPGAVFINSSITGNSSVLRCTVKNSAISGESRIRKTDVAQSIIADSYLNDSDEVVSKILNGVKLEKNKKLKRELV